MHLTFRRSGQAQVITAQCVFSVHMVSAMAPAMTLLVSDSRSAAKKQGGCQEMTRSMYYPGLADWVVPLFSGMALS